VDTTSASTSPLQSALGEIELDSSGTAPHVLVSATELAIEIAREGREGRKIGTIFTIGAEEEVLQRSETLILDPLAGHPPQCRLIEDPDLRETVKELAQLDGGFIVSGAGEVVSACRYFEAQLSGVKQPLGLGSRHIAAASISAATGAIAIVVSESSIVRVYARGRLIKEILPEVWLLHRHMSRITAPSLTKDDTENLAILGADSAE
jgi:diadenylate cyclase